MKSKALTAGLFVLLVCFLVGIRGDVRVDQDSYFIPGTELPPPPVPNIEDTGEGADQPGLLGATASNSPDWINCGGKKWVNYDFCSNSKNIAQNNVDWPIMIIFYGNATVDKVKDIYGGKTIFGASQYAAYDIGSVTQWDSDRGTKVSVEFCGPDKYFNPTLHLRIYAPRADYFDGDGGWGHYVIASAHFDFNPPLDTVCGYSEDCADMALQIAASKGYTVSYDCFYIGNYERFRNENGHWWKSNGYVSLVYVP
jgi:hypothetical protein